MPSAHELAEWLTLGGARRRVPADPRIFLTFDDGPHPEHTPQLLQVLDHYGARATFFMLGSALERHTEVAARVHAAGHRLANHSTTHAWFHRLSWRQQRAEIAHTGALLRTVDARERHWFRPPHGRVSGAVLAAALLRRVPTALWTTDSLDYRLDATGVIAHLRTRGVHGGDILLFHDDAPVAALALQVLLPEWRARGLRCEPLPDPGNTA